MDLTPFSTVIGVIIAMMAFIGGFVFWAFNKLDGDIKSFSLDIKEQIKKMDIKFEKMEQRAIEENRKWINV